MPKIFENIMKSRPRYSAFDLSHERKLSFNMGDLVPCYLDEVLPGDHFKVKTETMLRMAPMLAPVMHRLNVYVHYFFVPNRIIWSDWESFITGGKDGLSAPTFPTKNFSEASGQVGTIKGSLVDHMGLPDVNDGNLEFSQLPFRAYQQIYNDYYIDPNLGTPVDVLAGGDDIFDMQKRAWEKDYFTSALPFSQRGADVDIPVGFSYKDTSEVIRDDGTALGAGSHDLRATAAAGASGGNYRSIEASTEGDVRIENLEQGQVNVDIRELRRSSALQRWLELNARGGYRYVEQLLSHFGVKSPDARLQRAEYLGGGRQPVVFSEVLNTTGTATAPQGDMTGHGISVGSTNQFRKSFDEHGYVMGVLSVLPRTIYQQGVPRHFMRKDKLDYYFPEFANIGEQEIKNHELYYTGSGSDSVSDDTFGYQQRYAEYKHACGSVHGDFKDTLNFWHMGRIFSSQPALNESFMKSDPTNRIFAVATGDKLWCQLYNEVHARRPMPYFSNPKLS